MSATLCIVNLTFHTSQVPWKDVTTVMNLGSEAALLEQLKEAEGQ